MLLVTYLVMHQENWVPDTINGKRIMLALSIMQKVRDRDFWSMANFCPVCKQHTTFSPELSALLEFEKVKLWALNFDFLFRVLKSRVVGRDPFHQPSHSSHEYFPSLNILWQLQRSIFELLLLNFSGEVKFEKVDSVLCDILKLIMNHLSDSQHEGC